MKFFVTGTDTDVGKTFISTLLCLKLNAHYWKPVQSGLEETDSNILNKYLAPEKVIPEVHRLTQPMSPNQAADIDKVKIKLSDFSIPKVDKLIVEGAGGLMVPLNDEDLILDLIKKLNIPTIVVCRSGLGTLNHTLLTVDKLVENRIKVQGYVLNGPKNKHNKDTLQQYLTVPCLGEIEYTEDTSLNNLKNLANSIELNP